MTNQDTRTAAEQALREAGFKQNGHGWERKNPYTSFKSDWVSISRPQGFCGYKWDEEWITVRMFCPLSDFPFLRAISLDDVRQAVRAVVAEYDEETEAAIEAAARGIRPSAVNPQAAESVADAVVQRLKERGGR